MGIQEYKTQILQFFRENFLEQGEGNSEELVDVIREKLMLIEDSAERKTLVTSVVDEIHELTLIQKYKNLYSTKQYHGSTQTLAPNVVEYLSYSFKRMM